MTSWLQADHACSRRLPGWVGAAVVSAVLVWAPSLCAEQAYPFEGTWARADRICSATTPNTRTYTAREVTTSSGHCVLRKVAFGSGEWELFEDCRHPEHQGNVTERIRMLGPDAILVKRQVVRLKIPRGLRFARCSLAAPQKPVPAGRLLPLVPGPKP